MVLELRGDRAVLGPVAGVVRPHRELVDEDPAVAGLEQLDREDAGRRRAPGDPAAPSAAPAWPAPGRGRAPARPPRGRCRRAACDSTTGYAAAWPLGERATSAASSRRKSTCSSARTRTPVAAAVANAGSASSAVADDPDALAVVAAAGGLEHARAARTPRPRPTSSHDRVPRARARRARSSAPASRPCPGRGPAPPGRAGRRRRSASSACRWSVGTCSWSKVTTCAPARSPSRSVVEVAVVADDVSGMTCAAETPSASASSRSGMPERRGRLGHHPGELSAADDGDGRRAQRVVTHPRQRRGWSRGLRPRPPRAAAPRPGCWAPRARNAVRDPGSW